MTDSRADITNWRRFILMSRAEFSSQCHQACPISAPEDCSRLKVQYTPTFQYHKEIRQDIAYAADFQMHKTLIQMACHYQHLRNNSMELQSLDLTSFRQFVCKHKYDRRHFTVVNSNNRLLYRHPVFRHYWFWLSMVALCDCWPTSYIMIFGSFPGFRRTSSAENCELLITFESFGQKRWQPKLTHI